MTPSNKKKLQDAWRSAMNRNPYADTPLQGIALDFVDIPPALEGKPVTPRALMEETLASEDFYKKTDQYLKETHTTLSVFIQKNWPKP